MEFRFFCPSCGQKLKADEEAAGRPVDCPNCGIEFRIPQPESAPPTPTAGLPIEPPRDPALRDHDGNVNSYYDDPHDATGRNTRLAQRVAPA